MIESILSSIEITDLDLSAKTWSAMGANKTEDANMMVLKEQQPGVLHQPESVQSNGDKWNIPPS